MNRRERLRAKKRQARSRVFKFLIFVGIICIIVINSKNIFKLSSTNAQDINNHNKQDENTMNNSDIEETDNAKTESEEIGNKEVESEEIGNKEVESVQEKYTLEGTTYLDENNNMIIKNVDDILVLVNKERSLPSDYIPKDLIVPDVKFSFKEDLPKKKMKKVAADALKELFDSAEKERIYLFARSGYRSYNTQKYLFDYNSKKYGEEAANKFSARPGQSEHQTGLAMDVTCQEVNFKLTEKFGQTKEGKWIKENSYKYGFIIRYLKDKEDVTGYTYEPWHIRYVGKEVAEYIYNNNISFEEFFSTT